MKQHKRRTCYQSNIRTNLFANEVLRIILCILTIFIYIYFGVRRINTYDVHLFVLSQTNLFLSINLVLHSFSFSFFDGQFRLISMLEYFLSPLQEMDPSYYNISVLFNHQFVDFLSFFIGFHCLCRRYQELVVSETNEKWYIAYLYFTRNHFMFMRFLNSWILNVWASRK